MNVGGGLFNDGLDSADAGGGGLFFFDFEVTDYTGVLYVGTTTDFARDWVLKIANGVDLEFFWVFIPEFAMSFQGVTGIIFVVFVEDHGKVSLNPGVNLVFDLLLLFGG